MNADLKNAPGIILTAEPGRESVDYISKLGARDYLGKPFQLIEEAQCGIALQPKAVAVAT